MDTTKHTNQNMLQMNKENLQQPTKKMPTPLVSSIIANCLLTILKQHGCPNQFCHIGCQEALHTVCSTLTLCRHHGQETFALFIDIVTAFDSINHEILYAILDKFGVPKDLTSTIWKMYSDCTIHLYKLKKKREKSNMEQEYNKETIWPLSFSCS